MKPRPRMPTQLSESLHKQLTAYALVASAAGVGALALATPALAKIVYTPANIPIPVNGGLVALDVNNDGINDFEFSNLSTKSVRYRQSVGIARPRNRIWEVRSSHAVYKKCAGALPPGSLVGASYHFDKAGTFLPMARNTGGSYGCPWQYVQGQAYLGLQFRIKGKIHYGWAGVQMTGWDPKTESITDYAYETIPKKAIIPGKTRGKDDASLGSLAQGAFGASAWN
jgi:hypothetical protein